MPDYGSGGNITVVMEGPFAGGGGASANMTKFDAPVENWKGAASPYSQVVNIPNISVNSKIDIHLSGEQIEQLSNQRITFVVQNVGGVATLIAIGDKPSANCTFLAVLADVVNITGEQIAICGNTVSTQAPRTNYAQSDSTKSDYLNGKDVLDKKIQDAQDTANEALSKANDAQPALNFVPVQQGFSAAGGNKISLAWQEAGNGRYGIAVKVDNSVIGTIIVDNTAFGGTLPIGNGGTGATTRTNALKNLNGGLGTPEHISLSFNNLQNTGLVTASATTQAVLEKMPANSSVAFNHYVSHEVRLSDVPFDYAHIILHKGSNNDFMYATALDISVGVMYEYRYHRSSNTYRNGWKRILTNQLTTDDYGTAFPSNAVTGQVYYLKG
jgi:hypothetical protein